MSRSAAVYLFSNNNKYLELQNYDIESKTIREIKKIVKIKIPSIRIPFNEDSIYFKAVKKKDPTKIDNAEDICKLILEFAKSVYQEKSLTYCP